MARSIQLAIARPRGKRFEEPACAYPSSAAVQAIERIPEREPSTLGEPKE